MVFVKVRETYDLHTVKNKMTVISVHTPDPDIIKLNYPGLLMQCRAYRPVKADVRVACASVLPLDPLGVGTSDGDVAPEDVFNPILYKAMSNKGMSQLEARINALTITGTGVDVNGKSAMVEVDTFTTADDEFNIYYGLLSNTHDWRHANPQSGLEMNGLRPYVYEMVYNAGDVMSQTYDGSAASFGTIGADGTAATQGILKVLGDAKPMPFINTTAYDGQVIAPGMDIGAIGNASQTVPWINCVVGAIIVPPSRLHELFYRMVVEWTIEFSSIRPLTEITNWTGIAGIGSSTHYQNYSYAAAKEAVTGSDESLLNNDTCMVSTNVDIKKVM